MNILQNLNLILIRTERTTFPKKCTIYIHKFSIFSPLHCLMARSVVFAAVLVYIDSLKNILFFVYIVFYIVYMINTGQRRSSRGHMHPHCNCMLHQFKKKKPSPWHSWIVGNVCEESLSSRSWWTSMFQLKITGFLVIPGIRVLEVQLPYTKKQDDCG